MIKHENQMNNQELTLDLIKGSQESMFNLLKKLITELEENEEYNLMQKKKEIMQEFFSLAKNNHLDSIKTYVNELKDFLEYLKKENSTN